MKKLLLPFVLLSTLFLSGCKFGASPKAKLMPAFEEGCIKEIVADGQGRCNVSISYDNTTLEKGTYYYFYYSNKKTSKINDKNLLYYGLTDGSGYDKTFTIKFSYHPDIQNFYDNSDPIYIYIRYAKGHYPDSKEDYTWSELSAPLVLNKSDVPTE